MSEITAKQKGALWMSLAAMVFELTVRLPLWFALVAYILYTINAGFTGWILFVLYVPSQIIGFVLGRMVTNAFKKVGEENNEQLEASERFINARRTN